MALNPATLADSLTALFDGRNGFPGSAEDAGTAWASAYRQYAAAANAGPTAPLADSLTAAEETLAGTLGTAFTAARKDGPAKLPAALDAAFVAFWLTPPVKLAAPGVAGIVTIAPPGVLDPKLSDAFAAGIARRRTAGEQAQEIAAALDAWTRTVIVVNTPPGPNSPVPLT